jgi:voltage-gated potassium channel
MMMFEQSAGQAPGQTDRHAPYLVFMLFLSVYAVAALAVSTFVVLSPPTRTILEYADTAVCVLFFVDFVITFARAPNRSRYLVTWGWLDLLSSIPTVDALRWGRAARIVRIVRVLRGIRATKILTEFILYRRAQSAFLAALLVSILLVVFAASAILQFETSADANIRTAEDAAWWAVVTLTTVGYGDKFPVSTEGRLVATLLMTAGVGLFGTFSGFIAAWFLESPTRTSPERDAIEDLRREVANLREEIRGRP